MNAFIETLNNLASGLLPIAWQMLWQSSLLIAVVFALDLALRRKVRAAVRYALWLVVLIKLIIPPTFALPTGVAWWVRSAQPPPPAMQMKLYVVSHPNRERIEPPAEVIALFTGGAMQRSSPILSWAGWAFFASGVFSISLLTWAFFRWRQVARLVHDASPATELLSRLLDETGRNIGVRRRVKLLITDHLMSPAVCGLIRPVILLPDSLAEHLQPNKLRAVLIHELVHLKRRDVWVNCLQALVQIVYWWHPLVWFANARIRRVREEAVDDTVMLALRDEADCYAPTLLEVAKHAFHRPLASLGLVGILESRGALRQRIERLVDFKMPRRAGLSFVSLLGIAAFTAVAVPMGEAPPRPSTELKAPSGLLASPNGLRPRPNAPGAASVAGILTDPQFKTVIKALQQRDGLNEFIGRTATTFPVADVNMLSNSNLSWQVLKANGFGPQAAGRLDEEPAHAVQPVELVQNSNAPVMQPTAVATTISPLDGVLAFDKELKEATVNPGEAEAKFKFNITNVSSFDVTITNILTSCGCTVAKMPTSPWLLAPGATGEIPVTMNLADKSGVLTKTVSINSDKGTKVLTVKATIRPLEETVPAPVIYTSPGRQALMQKLDQIRFENVSFNSTKLSEVVRTLSEEAKRHDPDNHGINFLIYTVPTAKPVVIDPTTGLQVSTARSSDTTGDMNSIVIKINPPLSNMRVADVLDAIVKSADKPIKYSIQDYGVVFSLKPANESPPLVTRKFKVDPNTFMQAIERETGISFPRAPQTTAAPSIPRVVVNGNRSAAGTVRTNLMSEVQSAFITFFRARGVDLSPPKHFFYGDRRGDLMVYATTKDLDIIESAIQTLSAAPPQINIRVKFIEMPTELAEALPFGGTNLSVGAPRVISLLTSPQVKELIPALQKKNGVEELSYGNVTTLSGRQVQFLVVEPQMQTAMKLLNTNHLTSTNPLPSGPTLDVIPAVAEDGYTIQMTLIPTLLEFLGYDDPGQYVIQAQSINGPSATVLPLPHFRLRQVTTSVVVWDGQTVVLGGLMPKNDLASIGKSFSDDQERALLIFITPTIIDPAGNRVHVDEDLNDDLNSPPRTNR